MHVWCFEAVQSCAIACWQRSVCVLQEAVKNTQYWRLRDNAGKPPGLLGWWPTRAVVFIKNHDTDMRPVRPGHILAWPPSGLVCTSLHCQACSYTI